MSAREAPKTLRPVDDDPSLEDEESEDESSGRATRIKLPGARALATGGVIAAVAIGLAMIFWIGASLSSLDGSIQELRSEIVGEDIPAESLADELATPEPVVAETPPPAPEPTSEPEPELMLFGKPIVTHGADLWDCRDFLTWEQALTVYQANLPDDPNLIDFDGNGIPCESLRTES